MTDQAARAAQLRARVPRPPAPVLAEQLRRGLAPVTRRWQELHRRPRASTVVLVVALVSGAALRLVGLGSVGLNSDEAVYAGQGASLAGNPHFTPLFPIVRAHPLLVQILVSPLYRSGVPDQPGRYVAAAFGVGTIALVHVLGRTLYDARVGALAALFLAVMPYHVVISRQLMLDGPMTFFATASLTTFAAAARRGDGRLLPAAGMLLGLAALCKEPAVILLGAGFAFVALATRLWHPVRYPIIAAALTMTLTLTYPVLTSLSGGARGGQSYLVWQLSRPPNHSLGFYPVVVGGSIGLVLIAVAGAGLVLFRRRLSWRETLLLCWVAVPLLYFEIWPTKGFAYLAPLAPPVAVLAAVALARVGLAGRVRAVGGRLLAIGCVATLLVPSIAGIVSPTASGLAGAGGLPGGREAGRWIAGHTAPGTQLITIGPSMANVLQFYGGRRADGLSVSPNPLHRNPSYIPIRNADHALRSGQYQYIVWDGFSARRSAHFAERAMQLVRRFHGIPVLTERSADGRRLVTIYRVTP